MKIKLGEVQKAVLIQILKEKQFLQQEIARLIQRENETVAMICEGAGVKPVANMTLEGDELVVPIPPEDIIDTLVKELAEPKPVEKKKRK